MGNIRMKVDILDLYVLKDEFANRYIKYKNAKYTLTTDNVYEAQLFNFPQDAKDYLTKPYTIKKVCFNLSGSMIGHNVDILESDLEED